MLDAFIIEELERMRREQEGRHEQLQIELPEWDPRDEKPKETPKEEDKRGVLTFEM